MQPILSREASVSVGATPDALLAEMNLLLTETASVRDFLTSLVSALNAAIATGSITDATITGYRTDAGVALSSVNAVRTSLSGAIENLKAKQAGVSISEENLSGGGADNPDIQAAQANLQAAQAGLEKTVIRAPISGTINKLDLDVGSFVNASAPVVYITNAHGLEAVVFVSERDLPSITLGADATIAGKIHGKVTKIAAALDPTTKKAEIRISLPENAALVSGSSASVSISRKAIAGGTGPLSIPLSALKLTPESAVVFTVENGVIVSHPVILGQLRGSKVEIASGITSDMRIIEDARGLKEGQTVSVKN
jgi:RND family efflux transporter MFP subunit